MADAGYGAGFPGHLELVSSDESTDAALAESVREDLVANCFLLTVALIGLLFGAKNRAILWDFCNFLLTRRLTYQCNDL